MGKRGKSPEEKKAILLGLCHSSLEPYTLKQLEKLGAKAGVSQMSIKGILEEMVGDSMLEMDKIGSTNWFWSFPSQQLAKCTSQTNALKDELQQVRKQIEQCEKEKEALLAERQPSQERSAQLEELKRLQVQEASLKAKAAEMRDKDPDNLKDILREIDICKAAAMRWTDNVFSMYSYLKKKRGLSSKEARGHLQMKEDFDYPEFKPPKRAKKAASASKKK